MGPMPNDAPLVEVGESKPELTLSADERVTFQAEWLYGMTQHLFAPTVTDNQRAFVCYVALGLSSREAMLRAGYTTNTTNVEHKRLAGKLAPLIDKVARHAEKLRATVADEEVIANARYWFARATAEGQGRIALAANAQLKEFTAISRQQAQSPQVLILQQLNAARERAGRAPVVIDVVEAGAERVTPPTKASLPRPKQDN